MTLMNAVAIEDFLDDVYPHRLGTIEGVSDMRATMSLAIEDEHLRPGGCVSGATLMGLADICLFVAVIAQVGPEPGAVTASLNCHFLRRARGDRDLIANAHIVKLGQRLATGEVQLFSAGDDEPVALVTASYALPDRDD
ncbi:PaaI family thioesterase [Phytohalomonas tamaricis]|uniref:PaaI family thioesterase n=1 Tax=Phytohalomonas tamaricis TaxID=2081032 RepID=UPI000D0BB479|nr:PaaI family thioesterase [Phytohalomonas tamaricis]